jgi:hypothetical protein
MFYYSLFTESWLLLFWGFYILFTVLSSAAISFFLHYKYRKKNDTLIQEKLNSKDFPKIIGIINIIVLVLYAILTPIIKELVVEELKPTIFLLSLLTYGMVFFLCIMLHLIVICIAIYFLLFPVPLSVGSIVLTILQKNILTKRKIIFNIVLNSIILAIYYLFNIYFFNSIEILIKNSKEYIDAIKYFANI